MVQSNARLTWVDVLAWCLGRQRLDRRAPRDEALGVVREICGLHAQVMSSTELTLWARVEDLEPEAVREALWERRSLIETWAMRGTLHGAAAQYPDFRFEGFSEIRACSDGHARSSRRRS
jgi:hypothetical protein